LRIERELIGSSSSFGSGVTSILTLVVGVEVTTSAAGVSCLATVVFFSSSLPRSSFLCLRVYRKNT